MSGFPHLTRLLKRGNIAELMGAADYLAAVEAGFRAYANGDADVPLPMEGRLSRQGRTRDA